ncbi:MAG: secretin and TonB N-terminal domain-containing protein [Pseudomonadota bacterium]
MTARMNSLRVPLAAGLLCLSLTGCAGWWTAHRADSLIEEGRSTEGVQLYEKLARENPRRYLAPYVAARDREVRKLLAAAESARRTGDNARALEAYRAILEFNPRQPEALYGLDRLARSERHTVLLREARAALNEGNGRRAQRALGEILAEDPDHDEARALRQQVQVDANRELVSEPRLRESLRRKVSLEFRDASAAAIFEILAQTSGINFIFDRDVRPDIRTTIFARNTTVEDALRLLLDNAQLGMKVLNDNTVLVYPDTEDKSKRYEELVTRTFYLGSADPKRVLELVKEMADPQASWVDEKLRMLVVRDRLDVIDTVERLVAAYDIPAPEVVLDLQVLEVSTDALLNLGLQAPSSVSTNVYGAAGKAGELTINELEDLDRSNFKVFLPDPLALVNLQQTSGASNTLANPRIRVKSLEKAKILIGDKVPVITTTTNDVSVSESVNYLDVGLKLQAEPEVHANSDVSINLELEVSNIVKEVKTASGLLTYQIGTRTANTALRLRDGETQVLAGLIRDDERRSASHVPGIGKLPLVGRLFSSRNDTRSKSEIVLLITPHVVRSLHRPAADVVEYVSGTASSVSTRPLRLTPAGSYSTKKLPELPKAPPAAATPTALPEPAPAVAPAPAPQETETAAPRDVPAVTAAIVPDNDGGNTAQETAPATPEPATPETAAPDTVAPEEETRLDPALAQVRLDMVAPAQIRAGREFTLAVMANGRPADELTFELQLSPAVLELVRAVPVGAQVTAETVAGGIRVSAKGVTGNGPMVMLSLRAPAAQTRIAIRMARVEAKRAGDIALLVSSALPRELRVTP